MSDGLPPQNPFGGDGPFEGTEFLTELLKMLSGSTAGVSDSARKLAHTIANDGASEPNIDPTDRIAVEQLVRVAELQVAAVTDLPSPTTAVTVDVGNRTQWADQTIDDYRPLVETLADAMASSMEFPDDLTDNDLPPGLFTGLTDLMGPMTLGMTMGSVIGNLARRSLGGYSLPVPRPIGGPILILLRNVDEFGHDWSLDRDDLRLWVCLHEVAHAAVLSIPHVHAHLNGLLLQHAAGFSPNHERLLEQLSDFDLEAGPEALLNLQSMIGDPDLILGAVRSPAQQQLQPELTAVVAAITGYVDWVMDRIGSNLIGSYPMVTEALRRQRVEANSNDRFVERILGLELDAAHYDRGTAFADGVVERAGSEGLHRLFTDVAHLPTPAEIDAPGLWLARIDLPG
jgi:putative hydrolase